MLSLRDSSNWQISDDDFGAGEDDYWNTSKIKAFNFEAQADAQVFGVSKSSTSRLTQQVLAGCDSREQGTSNEAPAPSARPHPNVPIESLIPPKVLNRIILAEIPQELIPSTSDVKEEIKILRSRVKDIYIAPAPDVTVRRITLFQPHTLEPYKSLDQKENLLKTAISQGDGNAILKVVLFIRNTLTISHFQKILMKNPTALSHYVRYLAARNEYSKLTEILEMLGRTRESAILQFSLCVQSSSPDRQLKSLRKVFTSYFAQGNSREKEIVGNLISLLEWQQAVSSQDNEDLCGKSVMESLRHACRHHWKDPRNAHTSPMTLLNAHNMTDLMFQSVALTILCEKQAWSDIESLFITKSWLGSKVKSAIPISRIISILQSHNAPEEQISRYRAYADSNVKVQVPRVLGKHLGTSSEK